MKDKKLSVETVEKIEKCLYTFGKPCEVKLEHGKPTVIVIQRQVFKDKVLDSKEESNK